MSISHTGFNSIKLGQLQSRVLGLQNEITSMRNEIRLGNSTITGGDSISINPSGGGQLVVKSEDDGIVLEGSKLVVIEATDTEIDSDEKNAVNKRYVSKYLLRTNGYDLRRLAWNSNSLIFQYRSNTTSPWYDGISLLSTNYLRATGLQFSGNISTYVDSILGSNSSKSNNNTSIATAGYVDTHYYDKTTSDSNYLAINGTAANASKMEWTYNNSTYSLGNYNAFLTLSGGGNSNFMASSGGVLASNVFYVTNRTQFGYKIDSNSITTDTTKWQGQIANVANSTYIANRTSTPYSSVTNLDTLVPSLKVLEDNYLSQMNSTRMRRMIWDSDTIRLQTRYSTSASWTTMTSINANSGTIATTIIYIGKTTAGGNYVDSIATSSSTISTSNTTVATKGYVDQYYAKKTDVPSSSTIISLTNLFPSQSVSIASKAIDTYLLPFFDSSNPPSGFDLNVLAGRCYVKMKLELDCSGQSTTDTEEICKSVQIMLSKGVNNSSSNSVTRIANGGLYLQSSSPKTITCELSGISTDIISNPTSGSFIVNYSNVSTSSITVTVSNCEFHYWAI